MFVYTRGWNIDLCQNDDAIDAKIIWINEQVSVNESSGTIERQIGSSLASTVKNWQWRAGHLRGPTN